MVDDTTVTVKFTPVELTLMAAAVNERIAWLDSEIDRVRRLAEEADAIFMFVENEETHRIMRLHYASIARRIEQALDVPFLDSGEAYLVMTR